MATFSAFDGTVRRQPTRCTNIGLFAVLPARKLYRNNTLLIQNLFLTIKKKDGIPSI